MDQLPLSGALLRARDRARTEDEVSQQEQEKSLKFRVLLLLTAFIASVAFVIMYPQAQPLLQKPSSVAAPDHHGSSPVKRSSGPNFVLIMADDQSDLLGDTGADVMPQLHEHLTSQGQRFLNYFTTTPICCPSRVTAWRGQHAHNHNFTDLMGSDMDGHGGWEKFKELQVDESYLPTWLQQLGYNTYYTGKFIVDYSVKNFRDPPKGWTDADLLVLPYLFQYYDPVFSRNGQDLQKYLGQYSTDVIADKAKAQIRTAATTGKPFFIQVAPIAPHATMGGPTSPGRNESLLDVGVLYPPLPAPRHWHLFSEKELPKPLLSFNEEDVSDKPIWIRSLHRLSKGNITLLEETYRNRLRALRAVDELIGGVVQQLEELGILDNTYILYTADNGYHLGTHRRGSGKESTYEEDIRIPLVIRGPGIKKRATTLQQAAHVDLAPTILTLAGANAPEELDGSPLPLIADDSDANVQLPISYPVQQDVGHRAHLPFSYFAGVVGDSEEQLLGPERPRNTNWTWRSLRVLDAWATPHHGTESHRLYPLQPGYKYTVICTNERELYDLKHDPNEANNLLQSDGAGDVAVPAKELHRLQQRLDVLFQVQQACWGSSCRTPFQIIHNDTRTQVKDLWSALDPKYDAVYQEVPPFQWKTCKRYQDLSNEENHFRSVLGIFPRGPDGVSLARINITRYQTGADVSSEPAARDPAGIADASMSSVQDGPRRLMQSAAHGTAQTILADVERYATPLQLKQHLSNLEVYGPKGLGHFYA